jgi:hypothetical protein
MGRSGKKEWQAHEAHDEWDDRARNRATGDVGVDTLQRGKGPKGLKPITEK